MHTFTDPAQRTWTVAINVAAVRRVRDALKLDLLSVIDGELLEKLAGDPCLLCDVLYVLCKPQAEERGIGDEQFGELLAGDVIDAATQALIEELIDFFPSRTRRPLGEMRAKLMALQAALTRKSLAKLDALDVEQTADQLLAAMEKLGPDGLAKLLASRPLASGSSSGTSPDSSDSTPVPIPSES